MGAPFPLNITRRRGGEGQLFYKFFYGRGAGFLFRRQEKSSGGRRGRGRKAAARGVARFSLAWVPGVWGWGSFGVSCSVPSNRWRFGLRNLEGDGREVESGGGAPEAGARRAL